MQKKKKKDRYLTITFELQFSVSATDIEICVQSVTWYGTTEKAYFSITRCCRENSFQYCAQPGAYNVKTGR